MLKSILSTGGFNLASQLLIFIVEIIIARILLPADFGAFALALIVVELLSVIGLKSFAISFVQSKLPSEKDLSSIVIFTGTISLFLSLISYFVVKQISNFWGGDSFVLSYSILIWILPVLTIEYVYRLSLMKKGYYWQMGASELASVVFYALVAILLSLNDFGLYALVYAFMARQFIKLLIVLFLTKNEYKILSGFSITSITKFFRMSMAMTLQSLFLFSTSNTDRYFVELAGGSAGVGLYTRALKMLQMPLNQIVRNVSSVLYVEFSNKQDDNEYLLKTFLTTTKVLGLLFIPASTMIVIYSDLIVITVYGENWIEMIPVLKVLVTGTVISSMSIILGDLLKSQGVVYREIISNIFSLLVLIIVSMLLYESFLVVGVAIAFVCAQLTFLLFQVFFLFNMLNSSPVPYFKAYLLPIYISSIIYGLFNFIILYVSKSTSFFILITIFSILFLFVFFDFKKNPSVFKLKFLKIIS